MHLQVDVAEQVVQLRLRVENLNALGVSVVTNAERPGNGVGVFSKKQQSQTMMQSLTNHESYVIFSMAFSKLLETK